MIDDPTRPPRSFREHPPCKGCPERFLACSDRCPKDARGEYGYKAWKAYQKEIDNKRKAYNALNRRKAWQKNG